MTIDDERELLGLLLTDRGRFRRIGSLAAESLSDPRHQVIFRAMAALHSVRKPATVADVTALLLTRHRIEDAGGRLYLLECVMAATDPSRFAALVAAYQPPRTTAAIVSPEPPAEDLPPHNLEAEQSVLGSILLDRDAIAIAQVLVRPEDFFHSVHGTIFAAMRDMFARREPCDYITLADELQRRKALDDIGGVAFLSSLLSVVPTAVHVEYYASIVRRHADMRRLADTGAAIVADAYRGATEDVEEYIRQMRSLAKVVDPRSERGLTIADRVEEVRTRAMLRWDNQLDELVIPTGFHEIDRSIYGGFRAGDLVFIAGRPGSGKTSMMLGMAMASAERTGRTSVVFEFEMDMEATTNRMIAQLAGVPFSVAYTQIEDEAKRARWLEASERLAGLPVVVVDQHRATGQMQAYLETLAADQRLGAVFVDHIEYVTDRIGGDNAERKIAEITQRLKNLGMHLSVPVIVLAQLSRDVESKEPFTPQLRHLKGSGAMEGVTDYALLLYRRKYYVDKGMLQPSPEVDYVSITSPYHSVDCYLAKSRNGNVKSIPLGWHAEAMQFVDVRIA